MSCILYIETSTTVCSVALSIDGTVFFDKTSFIGLSHASSIGVFIEEALVVVRKKELQLDAVAVSSGPGSYTGLRIGVSAAKGVCFGYSIPLIAIPTLDIVAYIAKQQHTDADLYCAMLDARRMEVYSAIYDTNLRQVRATMAEIITEESFSDLLVTNKVCFFGNGAAKCKELITSDNAFFLEEIDPLAVQMVPLAEQRFADGQFVDVAYFEPNYFKEFQATVAKNKVLRGL